MKLKPVLASLMLLGLAAPAFAVAPATATASTQSQIDAMKAQLNKMEAVVNQNNAGGFQQASDWTSRIAVSGMADIDAYHSNTSANFGIPTARTTGTLVTRNSNGTVVSDNRTTVRNSSGYTDNISINNANLFVDALVNDWTNVHVGLQYTSGINNQFNPLAAGRGNDTLDEAYVTLANFNESPVFFRAGREYLPFGVYNRYPMVQNPTQLLSETNGDAAQLGFVSPMGVYASIYGFRGLAQNTESSTRPRLNTWGADLGYAYADAIYGFKLDAGYINNFNNVNYVSASPMMNDANPGYPNRVGGVALSADANTGPFDAGLRYVAALQGMQGANTYTASGAQNAEPSAYGVELGYTFPVMAHQSRAALGYQHTYNSAAGTKQVTEQSVGGSNTTTTFTGDTVNTGVGSYGLPLQRYYANYTVNVSKWTDVGFEVYHDRDYSVVRGGTGTSATVGALQLGVKFA